VRQGGPAVAARWLRSRHVSPIALWTRLGGHINPRRKRTRDVGLRPFREPALQVLHGDEAVLDSAYGQGGFGVRGSADGVVFVADALDVGSDGGRRDV